MRRKSLEIEDIIQLFKENEIMTIEEMVQKTSHSKDTIFRRLREHGYHNSYNKNGKYYTIPELAVFDDEGFWRINDVYFSKFGGIKDTVNVLVENSEKGYTAEEINLKIGTRVSNHLKGFVQKGILIRRKYGALYIYFSTDKKRQKIQIDKREQQIITKNTPEFNEDIGIQKIDNSQISPVLIEFINDKKVTPEEVTDALEKKNIGTRKEIVDEIFYKYYLLKKNDLSLE